MPDITSSRSSASAAALFLLVIAILTAPLGALVLDAVADTGGGAASTTVTPDPVSDSVAATAAEFRVDESGSAAYSIPLYGVPGTAGVSPKLSLNYSSQGGYGPLGKGWSIGGLSSIARCRATRESGDFVSAPTVDGNPAPINFGVTDRYCLDGQRLIAIANSPVCAAVGGMSAQQFRTEVESFQRVCAYTTTGATSGPSFFTIERKDGSISWYGDRNNNATANRTDGYFETNSPLNPTAALLWAQTRFQDSTGNYIDFVYAENPGGAATREHLISEILYTGKTVLSGQTGSAKAPYAKVSFNYGVRAAAQQAKGYSSGGTLDQTRRLDSITSCASAVAGACATTSQARYYQFTYATAASGNGMDTLINLQECKDSGKAVCMAPTTFTWSQAKNEFATSESTTDTLGNWFSPFQGMKWGDVDGDGRQDMVFILEADSSGTCSTETIYVAFSTLDTTNKLTFQNNWKKTCTPAELLPERGNGSWHLLDYNGDGRDDLLVGGATNTPWRIYPSMGRAGHTTKIFDDSQNLLAGLPSPITTDGVAKRQLQLTDLNGDGLQDIIYPVGSSMAARLMERVSGGFAFGTERSILMQGAAQNCPPNSSCTYWYEPTSFMGFNQLFDMNGDGSSDVLIQVNKNVTRQPDPDCMPEPGFPCEPTTTLNVSVWPYVVSEIATTQIKMTSYGVGALPIIPTSQAGDFNGDGLTDFATVNESTGYVVFRINTGTGFNSSVPNQGPFPNPKHLKVVDVNGDGRSDLVYPNTIGSNKAFVARLALLSGGFSATETALPGGNAIHCFGSGCNVDEKISLFGDYDGDGALEHVRFNPSDDQTGSIVSRAGASSQFVPRDVITRITNGFSAQTDITYAALTNKDLYRRDTNSRNGLNWGRGSPVLDLLAPSYAVARVSSSSPQAGAPLAKATVHYRYAGAKVQAGGRGLLGFREIITFDPNQTGGYVVSGTTYAQNFPYVGMPLSTVKRAHAGATYLTPACLSGAITNTCFTVPGDFFPSVGGSTFSTSLQDWETAPVFSPGAQAPLHVRTTGTDEALRDPFTGSQTSRVMTTFGYGTYGNVASTSVDTYAGTSTSPASTVITANTYADDTAKWRLGRLTFSQITHTRPNTSSVVRTSSFAYSMTGPMTGLLTAERSQSGAPAGQDLRKEYTYDDYGNQIVSEVCADPATACSTAINFHPATPTVIQRYSRTTYDSIGRYPVSKVEPFWNGAGAAEKTVSTVVARNIYGDITQAYDLNGVDSLAVAGTLGRRYYAWTETVAGSVPGAPAGGIDSYATYRFCGAGTNQVSCPAGAKFREQVSTEGAPRQWTYYDVLGRSVMKAAETFNVAVIDKDVSASCTDYDATGKPKRVSNPFFLAGTGGADGPTGLDGVCAAAARLWTTTTYDVLGRPTRVESPDPAGVAVVTNSYENMKTSTTDPRGNVTVQIRKAEGEVAQTIDAAGLVMSYYHNADGTLHHVSRDAGRGVITNSFGYDALGRKISQTDPDSGYSQFQYNALGELIVQIDASGQRIENEYDGRGRVWRRTVKTATGAIETQSTLTFDTAADGVGRLASEIITGTYSGWTGQTALAHSYTRGYAYTSLGQPRSVDSVIDGVTYSQVTGYDALGRAWKWRDASGQHYKTAINSRGFVAGVCNSSATDTIGACPADANTYLANGETDAWGHTLKERRGNSTALDVVRTYQPSNGRIFSLCGGNQVTCNLMSEAYAWDKAGNLSTHQKENRYAELFTYDSLNRLTEARMNMRNGVTDNQVMLAHTYDKLGNICRKTEGGVTDDYTYLGMTGCGTGGLPGSGGSGPVGPHQMSAQSTGTFFYHDTPGNQTLSDAAGTQSDRTVRYNAANQAYEIAIGVTTSPSKRVRFWYGPDGQRYKQDDGVQKTLYVGGVEIVVQGASTTFRRYVAGVMLQTVTGTVAVNKYLFHDHLGSLVRVANPDGSVAESLDYAPYGKPRSYTDPTVLTNPSPTAATPRGFTGHEHLPGTGIIHMNGRIYSPKHGRFLQPDPMIQAPGNAQSWNAYAYVFNNPLTNTDPTGMMSERGWNNVWMAVGVGVTFMSGGAAGPYFATGQAATGYLILAAGGYFSGIATTGTLKGGLTSAFTAVLTAGAANYANTVGSAAGVLAQATAGGIVESLQGGNFGHGFARAGLMASFMPQIGYIRNDYVRTAIGGLVGGTISAATGGKFANGAISGAIRGAMAKVARPNVRGKVGGRGPTDPKVAAAAMAEGEEAMASVRNNVYTNLDDLAADTSNALQPVTDKLHTEVAVRYFKNGDYYEAGSVVSDGEICVRGGLCGVSAWKSVNLNGSYMNAVGYYHTHPENISFSIDDLQYASAQSKHIMRNQHAYVSMPDGQVHTFNTSHFGAHPGDLTWESYRKYIERIK